jgi:hypothetical protein
MEDTQFPVGEDPDPGAPVLIRLILLTFDEVCEMLLGWCCVLVILFPLISDYWVMTDHTPHPRDRDVYVQVVLQEPRQILLRFELDFRMDCSGVERSVTFCRTSP